MTAQEIEKNKEKFIALCRKNIQREGLDDLLSYLEESDFYTAPSSCKFHMNEPGGLCLHSMNVFETACKLKEHVYDEAVREGESPFTKELSKESIAISTLFHDLCKINFYAVKEKWRKNEQNRWESYMGYEINDEFPLGHGEKSCILLHTFLKLTKEEMLAVRWHMGMFDMGEGGSSLRMSFYSALNLSPLVAIVHAADFLSSNLKEQTTEL